jgi:ABC-type branched-subunit amino acid transport system ATPase component
MLDAPSQRPAPRLVRDLQTLMVRLKGESVTILLVEQNAAWP